MRVLTALSLIFIVLDIHAQPASVILPKEGGIYFDGDSVIISWNADTGATSYNLDVDTDPQFSAPAYSAAGLSQTTLTIPPLSTATYYIRVRSYAGIDLRYTQLRSFRTFTPASLTNALSWYRGDEGLVVDGTNHISEWQNQILPTYHLQQATSTKQPTWISAGLNGKPSVSYDGSDALFTITNVPLGAFTIMAIWKSTGGLVYEHGPVATSVPGCFLYTTSCATTLVRRNSSDTRKDISASWGSQNKPTLSTQLYFNSNATHELRINGLNATLVTACGGTSDPGYQVTSQQFFLGNRNNTSIYFNGQFGDVLLVNERLPDSIILLVEQFLGQRYYPPVDLGADITVNYGFCNTTIPAPTYFTTYLWSTGATTSSINVNKPGKYWVTSTDPLGGSYTDTIVVHHPINLDYPDPICLGTTPSWDLLLDSTVYTFDWGNGNTSSSQVITGAGTYSVTVTDTNTCSASFSHTFSVDSFPAFPTLGPDRGVCAGEPIGLTAGEDDVVTYLWSTGGTSDTIQVWVSGTYGVTVTNSNGCTAVDTIDITILGGSLPVPNFFFGLPCAADSVIFTDISDPGSATIISWQWNFGDNTTSTLQHPKHLYDSAGTYNVELLITTNAGCSNSVTKAVSVNASPIADFGYGGVCLGTETIFVDLSLVSPGNLVLYEWNFGDGDTSMAQNPIHTYASSGLKTVIHTVTSNTGCTASDTGSVFIHIPPVAQFSFDSVCVGTSTTFIDQSIPSPTGGSNGWLWLFGDGQFSTQQHNVHQYNAGVYNVTLTVTDQSYYCYDDTTIVVEVFQLPQANFSHDDVCVGTAAQFTDLSISFPGPTSSWLWTFGDGDSSTIQNPTHVFDDTGTFPVQLVILNGIGCTDEQTTGVFVNPLPEPRFDFVPGWGAAPIDITFDNNTNEFDGPHTYEWYVDGSLVSTDKSPSHHFDTDGVYTVRLIATSEEGCVNSFEDSIFIVLPVLDVAVQQVVLTPQLKPNGDLEVSVKAQVVNVGTIKVDAIDMLASLQFDNPVVEHWQTSLFAGQVSWFEFTSAFVMQPGTEDFICVEARSPNGSDDAHPSDNTLCQPLEATLVLLDPYPNPTDDHVNFLILLPESDTLQLIEYDAMGRQVRDVISLAGSPGTNTLSVDVSAHAPGLYIYRLMVGGDMLESKVIVSR